MNSTMPMKRKHEKEIPKWKWNIRTSDGMVGRAAGNFLFHFLTFTYINEIRMRWIEINLVILRCTTIHNIPDSWSREDDPTIWISLRIYFHSNGFLFFRLISWENVLYLFWTFFFVNPANVTISPWGNFLLFTPE